MMSDGRRGLQISLPANAENIAVVRHAVAGLAEAWGMDEIGIADLKTVVTEACMNVVLHAYPEGPGPLEVEADLEGEEMAVAVSDHGVGIRPRADVERSSLRLGLSLIAALSGSFDISGGVNRGTRIAMRIPLRARREVGAEEATAGRPKQDATTLTVASPEMLSPVLARVIGALAARREITIDRLSDAVLLTDAISAGVPEGFADGLVRIDLSDREEGIDLRIGPMEAGFGDRMLRGLDLPDVGGNLAVLADELRVEQNGEGEYLLIRFASLSA